jgi:hypothetical protein
VNVVVEFGTGERSGEKCNRMYFIIGGIDKGKDSCKGIVGGVRFYEEWDVRNPMLEYRSGGESLLECLESLSTIVGEVPRSTLAGEPRERNSDVGEIVNETAVKVSESEEGLNIFDFTRLGPVQDGLDFILGHGEAFRRKDVAEEFDGVGVELAFVSSGEQLVFSESPEYFSDMLTMLRWAIGVDEDVVQVDEDANIEEVAKNVVHETLKRGRRIGETFGHYQPFK